MIHTMSRHWWPVALRGMLLHLTCAIHAATTAWATEPTP
jgi:hypothetical protein